MCSFRCIVQALIDKFRSLRVVVVGDIMLDHYIFGDAERISPEAPVPIVNVHREHDTLGGAANVALNLRALGAHVGIVGTIGQDIFGDKLHTQFRNHNIDVCAHLSETTDTIVKTRVICRDQQLCRIDRERQKKAYAFPLSEKQRLETFLKNADAVIISDYAKGVVDQPMVDFLTTFAHKHHILLAVDPKPKNNVLYRGVDVLTPNKQEALQMSGQLDESCGLDAVCRAILQRYAPNNLVVTLGSEGMLMQRADDTSYTKVPTYAHEVYDVSGAGDTAIAALTLALSAQSSLEVAVHFANLAAGVAVTKLGTATVTPEEILNAHDHILQSERGQWIKPSFSTATAR